jgi:hypothetical protein
MKDKGRNHFGPDQGLVSQHQQSGRRSRLLHRRQAESERTRETAGRIGVGDEMHPGGVELPGETSGSGRQHRHRSRQEPSGNRLCNGHGGVGDEWPAGEGMEQLVAAESATRPRREEERVHR